MHLQSGTRLGVYEIVSPLGAGGMGEVYRARDTRLDRTVALKVLPARFGGKSEARERFEREARVVSSLNHPNICALYDVGQHDDLAFFVMEYIEGQSLADRLGKGPLPLDQALRVAVDVADALAKAHRHGIVHRDLKPGNVMLTRTGAKLLDFGLARSANTGAVVMPDDPTVAADARLTAEGTIVGTLQYMAPEQLEGGPVDARTDLFAFGAMLYEMVTGQRAFSAATHASLITKIMSEEPRPVRELQPVTPLRLERLIARCLSKDPEQRWQCAADVVAELRTIAAGDETEAVSKRPRKPIAAWSVAAAALLAAVVLAVLLATKPAAPRQAIRFDLSSPTDDASISFSPLTIPLAVSPSGDRVAFLASEKGQRHLWIRSLSAAAPVKLAGSNDAVGPFWSPDEKSIAFFAGGKLLAADLATGAVRTICNVDRGGAQNGTWSPDGTIVFGQIGANDGIYSVPASGGTAKKMFTVKELYGYQFPHFLSDGKRFLFTGMDEYSSALYVASTEGTPPRRLQGETFCIAYVAPYAVYFRDGAVVAQRFDEQSLKFEGAAVPLLEDILAYSPLGSSVHSAGGRTLAGVPYERQALYWVERTGAEVAAAGPEADYHEIRISPDGRKVAAGIIDRKIGVAALWTLDVARKTLTRASFDPIAHENPVWSPDGKRIAFSSDLKGPWHLFAQDLAAGRRDELLPPGNMQFAREWLEDGRILFEENTGTTRSDIMIMSATDRKPMVWLRTPFNEFEPRVSPDGKWVVFSSDESGTRELYAAPIDRPADYVRLTSGGGRKVVWSRNGNEIYFQRGARDLFALRMQVEGGSIASAEPVHLFTARTNVVDYDVAADGRFLIARVDGTAGNVIRVVLNWQAELEDR